MADIDILRLQQLQIANGIAVYLGKKKRSMFYIKVRAHETGLYTLLQVTADVLLLYFKAA